MRVRGWIIWMGVEMYVMYKWRVKEEGKKTVQFHSNNNNKWIYEGIFYTFFLLWDECDPRHVARASRGYLSDCCLFANGRLRIYALHSFGLCWMGEQANKMRNESRILPVLSLYFTRVHKALNSHRMHTHNSQQGHDDDDGAAAERRWRRQYLNHKTWHLMMMLIIIITGIEYISIYCYDHHNIMVYHRDIQL